MHFKTHWCTSFHWLNLFEAGYVEAPSVEVDVDDNISLRFGWQDEIRRNRRNMEGDDEGEERCRCNRHYPSGDGWALGNCPGGIVT